MKYPVRFYIFRSILFHMWGFTSWEEYDFFLRKQTLIYCCEYIFRRCGRDTCSKTYNLFVEKEPGFFSFCINVGIIIPVRIGGCTINTVGYSSGKGRSASCLPTTLGHWNFIHLRSGNSGNAGPVPYRKYICIFITVHYYVGASVRHEIGF